jgi:hypothetical protein
VPPPPPGPPPPLGPPPPVGPPGAPPGWVSEGAAPLDGTAEETVVCVVGVVLLLGAFLSPPPHATDMTSIAPPPKTAKAVLAPDLIRITNLHSRLNCAGVAYPKFAPRNSTENAEYCCVTTYCEAACWFSI